MTPTTTVWILIGLAWFTINAIAFAMFAFDKAAAESRSPRISEDSLLTIALFGGSVGAIVGQQVLRHKTRKEPFRTMLYLIVVMHALLVGWIWWRGLSLFRHLTL